MNRLFLSILLTSCVGSLLTLFLMIFRPQTKKRFSANWHYYIWLVVLLVMLCPVRLVLPQKEVNMHTIIPSHQSVQTNAVQTETPFITTAAVPSQVAEPILTTENRINFDGQKVFSIASVLWFLIFGGMLAFKLIGYNRFIHTVWEKSEKTDSVSLSVYTKRKVSVRISDSNCSPLVVGAIKPTLVLPKMPLTETQMDYVLSHEMMHVNRMDILYKWLVCLIKCIHWFNPVVYYIGRRVNIDCEISCDAVVTKQMDAQEKCGYMETILTLLSANNQRILPLTTGMAGEKKTLMVRFSSLKDKVNISKKAKITSVAIAVLVFIFALIGSGLLNGMLVRGAKSKNKLEAEPIFTRYATPDVMETGNHHGYVVYDIESGEVQASYSVPALQAKEDINGTINIKSATVGDELYIGFEQITLNDISVEKLQDILKEAGLALQSGATVDLQKEYAVRPYGAVMQVQADQNGNISVYMPGIEQNFIIAFSDLETGETVGDYGVLGNNKYAYTFLGFEKEKMYSVTITPSTGTDWVQTGSYFIY